MRDQLLDTKFALPPVHQRRVVRQRLLERLCGAHTLDRQYRLTLLSAPAGSGKSTLLRDWVYSDSHIYDLSRIAWLSLDEQDNEDARFWRYVVAALQKSRPHLAEIVFSILQAPLSAPIEGLLTTLLNEINRLPEPLVLVLEDYHVIQASSIHQALTFLLDHLPPQLRLLIATRVDPPLPLARMRASGELFELRATDLRFTTQETQIFLDEVMGLSLVDGDVAHLTAQTEGWIAGLQLAALCLRDQEDAHRFVQAFGGTNAFVADYLTEEVLARQPQPMRDFLLQTAILKQMNDALASAVTGSTQTGAFLEKARLANLFLIPLDEQRQWYRYHHLFADLLRTRLHLKQPELVPLLYCRASEWCERNGMLHDAIEYALAGQQFEHADLLIERYAGSMLLGGELRTVSRWLETLPEQLIQTRARLSILCAWESLLSRKLPMIPLYLASAMRCLQGDVSEKVVHEVLGNAAGIEAYIARSRGQFTAAIDLSLQALKYLESLAEAAQIPHAAISINLGYTYATLGEIGDADRVFAQVRTVGLASRNIYLVLSAQCHQARLQMVQGQLLEAEASYVQALDLGPRALGHHLPGEASAYMGLGEIFYEWNRCDAALEMVTKGLELGELMGDVSILLDGYVVLARLSSAQGNVEQALVWLRRAKEQVHMAPHDQAHVAAWEARYRLLQGQVTATAQWAHQRGIHVDDHPTDRHEFELLTLARLLLAQHRTEAARPLLARLLSLAEAGKRMRSVLEILLLLALTCQASGQTQQALTPLTRALHLAEAQGYTRLFLDEGASMAALLRKVASQQMMSEYVTLLLAQFPSTATELPTSGRAPVQPSMKHLSEREIEVLRLVAAGLSNREVAQQLCVTAGAIKKHLNNIYGKLGVGSRTQAANYARDLELL
jgi:LuxR family maltose regulon positive regulatory protein